MLPSCMIEGGESAIILRTMCFLLRGQVRGWVLMVGGLWLGMAMSALAAPEAEPALRDVAYATSEDGVQKLDLYLPVPTFVNPPLCVYVHGGAWRAGSKEEVPVLGLLRHGFAVASIDYCLTPSAPFPANVYDIKAAIRYLRAHAAEYGYSAERVAILGSSAGAHLAALVGVTNDLPALEGRIGKDPRASSSVQAVVAFFGASNLETILAQSTPQGLQMRVPALKLLLGGSPTEKPDLARLASPVAQLDAKDPPMYWVHGDADPQMPYAQALEMQVAYQKAGLKFTLETVPGGGHGAPGFYGREMMARVAAFLKQSLETP